MKPIQTVGVAGAGAMGRGIAQIAAQAGLRVKLFDTNPAALNSARDTLTQTWTMLANKGKMTLEQAHEALGKLYLIDELEDLSDCDLVIEAIIERLDIKQTFFKQLESVVSADCILVSNTSSLSITSIAAGCAHPARVAGYHFFNPVPLMKVVEVIDGLRTDPAVGDALMSLSTRMGHTPVRAKDMPGFIVNHAGRGMNTEGLRVVQENVTDFVTVDSIMREQAGFKMGPFELMDLTGLDVSHAVMESIYRQFYEEPRFKPSPIGTVRVAGGLYGRKSQGGFYSYEDGQKQSVIEPAAPAITGPVKVWVSRAHPQGHERAEALLKRLGIKVQGGHQPDVDSLIVVTPYGEDVSTSVFKQKLDAARTVGLDTLHDFEQTRRRTLMVSPATHANYREMAHAIFGSDNVRVSVVRDSAGFVAQRIVAMIVNVACDIAQQDIATPQDIDRAVNLGLGYPKGPLGLGDALGAENILEILRNMQDVTGDPRYRPSLWLQRRVQLGISLLKV
ncbi:3-hydroxyacyl-CoA dehydrogenase [Zwartia vadi]|uniref:3-hydroxyacyl-CoA dehydrogenase n=1 Tax=Zwartia vadi TaxID=3058168 RepID=UPI0025B5EFAA|nr:3-hydroxyacyl-CoA dehydrogenase [Zwartia vadi]MDN3986254.1 3-hydroxyacyl-CoA dehydrogenase [Zwartia vadi]